MKVDLVDSMGSDLTVVNAARVSFDKTSSSLSDKDIKLIKYLAEHNHWSPFSHAFLQFRIKAPIFVARQLGKHQVGLSWNEVSRRYVNNEPEFYMPEEWRGRPDNIKQGSEGKIEIDMLHAFGCEHIKDYIEKEWDIPYKEGMKPDISVLDCVESALEECRAAYDLLLKSGVAPEMARMVLPQNTMTEWYWSGSLYAFARVCNQRLDENSQLETSYIANEIDEHCYELFPHSWEALRK